MGSSTSPLVADIFLNHVENKIFNSSALLLKYVFFYKRYVDDIFCIWTGTKRQLQMFLNFLNKIHKNIKFTLEIRINGSINFLDLNLTIINNKIEFNIFRKETYADIIIHNSSNHPFSQKILAFHYLINRLINIPLSPNNFKVELNTIKIIASNNGYNSKLIDDILNKKYKKKFHLSYIYPLLSDNIKKQWRKFLFVNHQTSNLIGKKIPNTIQPAYYTNNKLKNYILNNKDKDQKMKKSGVYQLNCNDCNHFYIGKTCRNFETRIKEHLRCLNSNNYSEFANHLIEFNHSFDINTGFKILHTNVGGFQLDLLEILEIRKNVNRNLNIINNQINFVNNPILNIFPL